MTTRKKKPSTAQRLDRFDERMAAIAMNLELTSMAQERTAQELAHLAQLAKKIFAGHNTRTTRLEGKAR